MEAKEKGAILDAGAEAFLADVECTIPYVEPLAITTTTAFEVSYEDAYDSDVDEAPHAASAFMANLMQTSPSTGKGTSNDTDFHSEVQTYDNYFFDNMHLQVTTCGPHKTNEEQSFANDSLKAELKRYKIQFVVLLRDDVPMSVEPRSNCVKEHSRNLELEAEILKVCNNSSSPELNVFFEINKLKDQIQGKNELIRKLKAQIGNMKECGVKNLNSVNAKNPKVKNNATMKQVWKATGKIFASVGSKWRPTGRKFTLGDTCPLTRITKPEVVPLEKSGSVSTSEPANNVIVTPRFSKKPLTSYKRKDSKLKDISTGSPPNIETKAVNDPVNVNDLSANQLDPNKNWKSKEESSVTNSLAGNAHKGFLDSFILLTWDVSNPNVRKAIADSVAERLERTIGCFFKQTDLSLSSIREVESDKFGLYDEEAAYWFRSNRSATESATAVSHIGLDTSHVRRMNESKNPLCAFPARLGTASGNVL
ncbi:hypothetical protein Tco_0715089 [Tanacetum coccineum]